MDDVKVEFEDDKKQEEVDADLEEMCGGGEHVCQEQMEVEENAADWNWEPDGDEDEVDGDEESEVENEDDLEKKSPETGTSVDISAPKWKNERMKDPLSSSPSQKRSSSKYIKKGTQNRLIRTEDGRFKCRQCDQTFASASGLNSHEREKHSKTPGAFVCDICGRAFNSRDYRRKHIQQSHKPKADATPKTKTSKMKRTDDGKYQCVQCDQVFQSQSGCTSHFRDKHSETPGAFICDICGRAFNSHDFLRNHKVISHKVKLDGTPIPKKAPKLEKDYICELCGKGFKIVTQLKRHVRFVHEKRFSLQCTLCGMGSPSTNGLKKHQLAMHPEDPLTKKLIEEEGLGLWKCPVIGCAVRFLKESSVKGHLKIKHGKDEEQVEGLHAGAGVVLEDSSLKATCEICGKVCVNKAVLKKHVEVHENEGKARDVFCESCGKGFVSGEQLKRHVDWVHLKKGRRPQGKDFKCELCGKGYTDRHKLKVHLELHEKEGRRDHFCDKCGNGFTLAKYLRVHLKRTSCGEEGKRARVYNRKGE